MVCCVCPAICADGLAGVIAIAAQRGAECDHRDREPQMQAVVGVVDGNEVGPGTKPRRPTARKTTPTARAAFWTGVPKLNVDPGM